MSKVHNRIPYIDCHTHILPGMDDGAKSLTESTQMLQMLLSQGVHTVWLTPHYYPFREELNEFLKRRDKSYSLLKPVADKKHINILPASETYLSDFIFNNDDLSELCIGKKYLLTELPCSRQSMDQVYRLISTYHVTPIIAHVERYPKILKDSEQLNQLVEMGCLIQVNLGSLASGVITRRRLLKHIELGLIHLVGTDCHNLTSRAPNYLNGISIVRKKLGFKCVEQLIHNAEKVMNNSQARLV